MSCCTLCKRVVRSRAAMASPILLFIPSHTYNTLFLREKWLTILRQHSVTLFHILAAVLEGRAAGSVRGVGLEVTTGFLA